MNTADHHNNTFDFVSGIMHRLAHAQIATWLCGGWAEELWGIYPARSHRDLDLVYPAPNFDRLDQWLALAPDLSNIPAKHFPHKRAFHSQGIMIEIMLLEPDAEGEYQTYFFNQRYHLVWPHNTLNRLSVRGQDVPVVSNEALGMYRSQHQHIAEAYQLYLHQQFS